MKWKIEQGFAVRSHEGFASCGDAVFVGGHGSEQLFAVVDALGHGPDAEFSARRVCEVLGGVGAQGLRDVFQACDQGLSGLREVVMAAVRVVEGSVSFAGVGNVEIIGPVGVARPVSQVGRVGRGIRSLREVELPIEAGQRWALASDGVRARELRGALDASSTLSPDLAAQRILELSGRRDDDATVLVLDFLETR